MASFDEIQGQSRRTSPGCLLSRGSRLLQSFCWLSLAGLLILEARGAATVDHPRPAVAQSPPVQMAEALLRTYYESFLNDRDLQAYETRVGSRLTDSLLCRLVSSDQEDTRRASVLALGLVGSIEVNATVAKALRDEDPVVRSLAENALWSIWFRADSPTNNADLERAVEALAGHRLREVIEITTRLIEKSPGFAEAYNQRAIAYFRLGEWEKSANDCRSTLQRNPYHIGALGGLSQCLIRLDRHSEAIDILRKASRLQPYHDGLKDLIRSLEVAGF